MSSFKTNAVSLLKASQLPHWETETNLDDVVTAVGRSFAGDKELGAPEEPIYAWLSRGLIPEDSDPVQACQFFMSFWLERNIRRGAFAFGHINNDDNNAQDAPLLQTCCVLHEVNPEKDFGNRSPLSNIVDTSMGIWLYVKARIQKKLPDFLLDTEKMDSAGAQMDREGDKLENVHRIHGPKTKHIYVVALATDPKSQGKGLGSQVMRQVNAIADAEGLPLYLECGGEKNRRFYEKFGYKVVEKETWTDGKLNVSTPVYPMIRMPTSAAQ